MKKKLNLFKQLILLVALILLVWLGFRACSGQKKKSNFQIQNTAMKIELIRNIAEIATISYEDEVVVDSIEYYKNLGEKISGNLKKLSDYDNFKHGIKGTSIKRRLTLIVKGKIRFGFDLNDKNFRVKDNDTILEIYVPKPIILDLNSTPSSTRIFQENGKWKDYEIRFLKEKSRKKMIKHFNQLRLNRNAQTNFQRVISSFLLKTKKVRFIFM